jgi:hypothetical protein
MLVEKVVILHWLSNVYICRAYLRETVSMTHSGKPVRKVKAVALERERI